MLPTLKGQDLVLIRYGATVRDNDLVVARFADGTLAIKRAAQRRTTPSGQAGWWLLSDNERSGIDSRHRGAVPDSAVLARVICRLWPCWRRRPSR